MWKAKGEWRLVAEAVGFVPESEVVGLTVGTKQQKPLAQSSRTTAK